MMPVVEILLSELKRSWYGAVAKSRLPVPMVTGNIFKRNSSTTHSKAFE
jgi:hypothetical protein